MCNILFLGGAKRVSMARLFKKAAAKRGEQVKIYSYEKDKHVPIALEGEVIVGLKWSDPRIYDDLLRVVRARDIRVIVPFVDGAVAVAATMAQRYPDLVFAPTPTPEQCEQMFDKVCSARLFEQAGLAVPPTYRQGDATKQLIAKPRHGSASKGLIFIDSEADLMALENPEKYLIQRRIDHREEYTVDCYASVRTGRLLAISPRKRIEVSGGEVTRTETVIFPEVYDLAKAAIERLGLRGAITVQVIRDLDRAVKVDSHRIDGMPEAESVMIMEVNPRLGGGAVCSVLAGADMPALILAEAAGVDPEPVCYRPYTEITRYPQEVVFFN